MSRRIAAGKACFARIALALVLVWAPLAAQGAILARLKNGENLNVAVIGTSLSVNHNPGWSEQAAAWMNSLPYTGKVTLHNEAVGATACIPVPGHPAGGTVQLDAALANDNPDVVFIEFAINDAFTPFKISRETSKKTLQSMIDKINAWAAAKKKNVEIIAQTMNNCTGDHFRDRPNLEQYYQGYREVVKANPGVLLIDHYPNWVNLYNSQADHATWNSYVYDGIHFNAAGSQNVMLPELQRVLNGQLPKVLAPFDIKIRKPK